MTSMPPFATAALSRSSSTDLPNSPIRKESSMLNSERETSRGEPKASVELASLLQDDPHLTQFNLVHLTSQKEAEPKQALIHSEDSSSIHSGVYEYASWLLLGAKAVNATIDSKKNTTPAVSWSVAQATVALEQVDRKLQWIQQLSQRISREKPEDVANPLLKLHGYSTDVKRLSSIDSTTIGTLHQNDTHPDEKDETATNLSNTYPESERQSTTLTLNSIRDQSDRLVRQAQVYEGMASRVESTLTRALKTMHLNTMKLQRVLNISKVLKIVMKLRFEAWKIMDLSSPTISSSLEIFLPTITQSSSPHPLSNSSSQVSIVDLRELTRTAASISVMKELLNIQEIRDAPIAMVEHLRPEVERLIRTVRTAAAKLMEDYHQQQTRDKIENYTSDGDDLLGGNLRNQSSSVYLSAALQVYFSLGELTSAVWTAIGSIFDKVEKVAGSLLNPAAMQRMMEAVKTEAKALAIKESSSNLKNKTPADTLHDRMKVKVLKEKRAEVASKLAHATLEACLQVWNLQRVLMRKSDPVTRQNYFTFVCQTPIPERFRSAEELMNGKSTHLDVYHRHEDKQKSIFTIFFNGFCISLGSRLQKLLKYDNGIISREVAALYPFIRSEYIGVVKSIHDVMQASSINPSSPEDLPSSYSTQGSSGIMGGSSCLTEAACFNFMQKSSESLSIHSDHWTKSAAKSKGTSNRATPATHLSSALAGTFSSLEWNAMHEAGSTIGLQPLQQIFVAEVQNRLNQPLDKLFPESVNVDENGIVTSMLFPLLPSKYDIETLEKRVCEELSLADPRSGGGEFSMVPTLSECVVVMVEKLCALARSASSGIHEDSLMNDNFVASEQLLHDIKVASVMDMLRSSLRKIPDLAFVAPYRPAALIQHEEASSMCEISLLPAIHEIDGMVTMQLVRPIIRFVNRRLATVIGSVHRGIYLDTKESGDGSFIERSLTPLFHSLQVNILSKLSSDYASLVATAVAIFSIYCFISNVTLIRPIGESSRLRITQDLGDFELALEQFLLKAGSDSAVPLNRINGGKPYAELRAVRQMLFWTGLESVSDSTEKLVADILRENWIKDLRPSTIVHFISSFGPKLFSSPHHIHRISAGEYVMNTLLTDEGSHEDGEVNAWLTILSCCESYQQRESLDNKSSDTGGDKRIVGMLLLLGPELLKRIRQ